MRTLRLVFLPVLLLLVGCASSSKRYTPLYELSAAPMSDAAWARIAGNYAGPIRSRVKTWMGTTGEKSEEVSLSLRGSALHPRIYMRIRGVYSTAWMGLGSYDDIYTNIPRLEYGAKVPREVSTHAPHALVVEIPKNIYIFNFKCPGSADVDQLGIHGWRGTGRIQRVPEYPCP